MSYNRKVNGKRRFFDAHYDERCMYTITLSDGSAAQCGRRKTVGELCTQHAKIVAAWHCDHCGGNDEFPPDHTQDCTSTTTAARAAGE